MHLRAYLDAHDVSLAQFAKLIGVADARTVQRYAAGERLPRPEIMARIARATDGAVQPGDFYAGGPGAAA